MRNNRFLGKVLLTAVGVGWLPLAAATLHFAGSSQLDDGGRKVKNYPYWSWGTELEKYMAPSNRVRNCARSGHSTKSFRADGHWKRLLDGVMPGDFVGIQFGGNDQKKSTAFYREKRYAAPNGLYRDILREWIGEVRAKGATPILISHSCRCTFGPDGKHLTEWESAPGEFLSTYREAMRSLAKELNCDFVDMNSMLTAKLESLGREEALKNYVISTGLVLGKNGEPNRDTTHPIKTGAELQAKLFLDNVRSQGCSVATLFERPETVIRASQKLDELRLDGSAMVRLEKGVTLDCKVVIAENATNVFLTGPGVIRLAKGGTMTFRNCQGVRLRDFELQSVDAKPLQILGSTDVMVKGVTVTGQAGEPLSLAGSRDVTVEKCRFSQLAVESLKQESEYAFIRDNVTAALPLNVLVPVNAASIPPADLAQALRQMRVEYGLRKFVLINPWRQRYFGHSEIEVFTQAGRDAKRIKEALSDLKNVELGWWVVPTIGHAKDLPGQKIVNMQGSVSNTACPLSEEFAVAWCKRLKAYLREAHPSIVFFEDDYNLSNHGGVGGIGGCFCPHHLAELSRRVGRALTREAVVACYRKPTPENAALRQTFAEVSRDSLATLAAKAREAINQVDPAIRTCLCQSGRCDFDGDFTEKVARAFAGSTRPMVRVFGASYFNESASGTLPAAVSHALWSAQTLPKDLEIIHETDPFPHTRFYNSSLFLVSELAAAMMGGVSGSYYYCTFYSDDPLEDPGYAARLKAYAKRFDVVRDLRAQMTPCGVRALYTPAESYMKRRGASSQKTAATFLSKQGLPLTFATDAAASIIVESTAEELSDAAITNLLAGGVLVDAAAAQVLAARGFSDLLGCDVGEVAEDDTFDYEEICAVAGCRRRGKKVYNRKMKTLPLPGWTPEKSDYIKLMPRPGAEIWSVLMDVNDQPVMPATVFYRNALGGRVGVLNRPLARTHVSMYNARKQEMFHRLFAKLSGGQLEVAAPSTPGTWLLAAKNDRELLVFVENIAGEPRADAELVFSDAWRTGTIEHLEADGTWRELGPAAARFRLPEPLYQPTTPEFFRVRK
ncbi:MAG: GDSL-type esterase/lipase family protein [Kiritimatiellae bacterium]|nr:GDSL-type esterase/lipase family protein [Kiritimatiellia bacterium]